MNPMRLIDAEKEFRDVADARIPRICPHTSGDDPQQLLCGSWCPFFTTDRDGDVVLYCSGSRFMPGFDGG